MKLHVVDCELAYCLKIKVFVLSETHLVNESFGNFTMKEKSCKHIYRSHFSTQSDLIHLEQSVDSCKSLIDILHHLSKPEKVPTNNFEQGELCNEWDKFRSIIFLLETMGRNGSS